MLELKLKQKNEIDATGSLVYLTDDTGAYGLSNTTGYGVPNAQRSEIAVFPIGSMVSSSGKEQEVSFVSYDPVTATEWSAKVSQDGWLKFAIAFAWTVADPHQAVIDEELPEGVVFFSIPDYKLQKHVIVHGISSFVDAKPSELLNRSATFEQFFIAKSSLVLIDITKQVSEAYINSENLSNTKRISLLQEQIQRVRAILQSAIYQFCIGNKFAAQRYIEFLQTNTYGLR